MESTFVEEFLKEIGSEEYLEKFTACKLMSPEEIKFLDKEVLLALGVTNLGDRLRILRKSKSLHRQKSQESCTEELNDIIRKISSLSAGGIAVNEELVTEKHSVIFILNDGSAKKVNVNGCFNADSIKKRLLKRLPPGVDGEELRSVQDYDVFVVDYVKNVLHLLYDVELVTICHSSDRMEKNRLIFVSKNQTPSDKAVLTSKKLYLKTLSVINQMITMPSENATENPLRIENGKDKIRKIFNQRPPSELISTNLAGYFPHANMKHLESTLKESFRQSARLSKIEHKVHNSDSNKIGDILLKHSNAVDSILLQNLENEGSTREIHNYNMAVEKKRDPVLGKKDNRVDLRSAGSEADLEEDDENDMVSLPTRIMAPKTWLKGARIGSGSFGTVYLGMNARTGELMAVKQVELQSNAVAAGVVNVAEDRKPPDNWDPKQEQKMKNASRVHRKLIDALQHEMSLLKDLHHENIVKYFGSSQEGGNLNIFLEYVPGGSVSSMLNSYGPFEESLITNFTRQILIGVVYLHKKNIIHRDIKGANILIDIKGCVKITDFGISKKLSPLNQAQNKRASLQGSVYWMAPEVVKQAATTEKADIWSTGCVVIEMFTGKHPFPDFSQMQAIFKIGTSTTPEIPSWATEQSRDFLSKAFQLDYKKRPSAIELLQHPWLDAHVL
ncbi:BN860_15874g1_1 [Zygosaccharomyces bailii CLIB 213]|uniref:Serine/threonine-protein kinase STE11 n=1 Tax=Zygosaccharomyces bailii (strain CLIB 213 / ATCC 58445 / CBS 680 / BCRC 21525 / NBRC 1098 / NCYC 1416 / NRRL Y-2227) TaxID=1333698 RepID=A0A8J2T3R5_ZYGB2|nr:BN860_15874g1_1 [Zygosaccharomyces bailii CLIB 213]